MFFMRDNIICNSNNLRMIIPANDSRNRTQTWRHKRCPIAHEEQIRFKTPYLPPDFNPVEWINRIDFYPDNQTFGCRLIRKLGLAWKQEGRILKRKSVVDYFITIINKRFCKSFIKCSYTSTTERPCRTKKNNFSFQSS